MFVVVFFAFWYFEVTRSSAIYRLVKFVSEQQSIGASHHRPLAAVTRNSGARHEKCVLFYIFLFLALDP